MRGLKYLNQCGPIVKADFYRNAARFGFHEIDPDQEMARERERKRLLSVAAGEILYQVKQQRGRSWTPQKSR